MVGRVKEELGKPFWNGWTLKDVAIIGSVVATLAVDHANIQRIMTDVTAMRQEMSAYRKETMEYRQSTTNDITAIRLEQQRVSDALMRFNDAAIDDKRVPHETNGRYTH